MKKSTQRSSIALVIPSYVVMLLAALVTLGSLGAAQSREECTACHGDNTLSMQKKGRVVSLFVDEGAYAGSAHGDLECVACHEGFAPDALPHAKKITPVDCFSCHESEQFAGYSRSAHGKKTASLKGSCADCHSTHAVQKLNDKPPRERKELGSKMCATCHADVRAKYMVSDHGKALAAGTNGAPGCADCHTAHDIRSSSDADAPTSRNHEAAMCLSCHLDNPEVRAKVGPSVGFISSYENSVHARAVKNGNDAAATCSDCHGSHEMKKGSNPDSRVAKKHIAETCGQCHGDIREQYDQSIHGKALAGGIDASATCTDCHGEHNILSPKDALSPVSARNVSSQVCSPCHASVKLSEKYGLASDRFQSFRDSYHGLAGIGGSVEVANCASCHGIHDIKPSTDSTSRIHKSNLAHTCGTCHPGANENFTKGAVHIIATDAGDEVLYLVSTGYIILIVVIIGGMLLHNALDFVRKSRRQLMFRRGILQREHVPHRLYLRMNLSERFQHGTLAVSFILLVITGFMLKFPDAWWVIPIRDVSPVVFEIRGVLHRIAAVVMVLASCYHVYYILAVPRGKQLVRDLLPVRQDITDALDVMRYNLGISSQKPKLGRFSYIEKSEYWALVWGTIVMAITGTILWFDNTFLGLITKLWWDVARTVHYYEAWLATLAIIVWHFYFVIFNPDSYPLNLAFWKGTLTEEEMAEEHALELGQIKERERQERLLEEEDRNARNTISKTHSDNH